MSCVDRTPEGVSYLHRQECTAVYDQVAAMFAGDAEAFVEAQEREREARDALLAIAGVRPS